MIRIIVADDHQLIREGIKKIVREHASAAGDVDVADEGSFTDIDTPAEYAAAAARL